MISKKSKGFTIVEILIALAIASIIALGAYTLFLNQQNFNIIQQRKAQLQRNMRVAMNIMLQDIGKAGYDPTSSGDFGITLSGSSEIRYTVDKDGDGVIDDGEEYRFRLDGTILKYTKDADVGDPTDSCNWHAVNASPVEFTSLQFTYLDVGDPTDGVYDKVSIILGGRIMLPLKSGVYETQTLTADVILRNKI